MDGNNPQQGAGQQKPGLSWTQPASTTNKNDTPPALTPVSKAAPTAQPADATGRTIGIVTGIVVVFVLVAWAVVVLNKRSSTSDTSVATSTTEVIDSTVSTLTSKIASVDVAPAGSASVAVATQAAGNTTVVTDMVLTQPTWIVVYGNRAGSPSGILGAGLFFAGDTTGTIDLLRPTIAGQTHFVTAALDNGDRVFAKDKESFVRGQEGGQMWIKFQTN